MCGVHGPSPTVCQCENPQAAILSPAFDKPKTCLLIEKPCQKVVPIDKYVRKHSDVLSLPTSTPTLANGSHTKSLGGLYRTVCTNAYVMDKPIVPVITGFTSTNQHRTTSYVLATAPITDGAYPSEPLRFAPINTSVCTYVPCCANVS